MATLSDVRRIALALPGSEEGTAMSGQLAFSVPAKGKKNGYAWLWMERVEPKKPRIVNRGVLAVRVANVPQRDALIAAEPRKFFTEPHYDGYPAVLVRLKEVTTKDLRTLLEDAWRCRGGGAVVPAKRAARRRGRTR